MAVALGMVLVIGIIAVLAAFYLERTFRERERRKRARAIRVGWMPHKPTVEEIKLRMKIEPR